MTPDIEYYLREKIAARDIEIERLHALHLERTKTTHKALTENAAEIGQYKELLEAERRVVYKRDAEIGQYRRALDNIKIRAYELGVPELHDMALEPLKPASDGLPDLEAVCRQCLFTYTACTCELFDGKLPVSDEQKLGICPTCPGSSNEACCDYERRRVSTAQRCKHGNDLAGYCLPCGRIHGA